LAAHLGLDLTSVAPDVDVLTPEQGDLGYANTPVKTTAGQRQEDPVMVVQPIDVPDYSAAPSSLLTQGSIARHGWEAAPAGWLLETDQPLTVAQIRDARDHANQAGFAIEVRDQQPALSDLRTAATVVGMALALAILAMTIGLLRGEATRELQTLVATGATSGTRRTIVAATAGTLAVLGVGIGIAGAYLALVAAYLDDLAPLSQVPLAHLVTVAIGVPLLASAAGWLLSGREPPLSRVGLE
jgi:putative ABC transport system permease protein